ncbi:hypothetical protein [Leptospira santarosai]|uniref:hypothetical protein n=1 Tax=Leptospira santarosai TaxID=28183 RepID=UPI0024AE8E29|nr:hypothetical protein [Leptospira santarosai]MDI7165912.1 hypothetical protein [Leptospira santarosai]
MSVVASWGERIIAKIGTVAVVGIVTSGIVAAVSDLAGKQTNATIDVGISALIDFAKKTDLIGILGYIFGSFGVLYGLKQKKLRSDNIERLGSRRAEYERRHNPNRSTSGLAINGRTAQEDR